MIDSKKLKIINLYIFFSDMILNFGYDFKDIFPC
jgi:hypothetical protein